MHETRKGEMAVLRELPFGRYYGGVDTTPLYFYLAVAYADRTGDMGFIDDLWPSLIAAAGWMEEVGRRNGDGFVTYKRAAESGLSNQGWKDSLDSIFHADGRIPQGPIALVEVQGYVFAAYRGLAALARRRGEEAARRTLARPGRNVARRVEAQFWMEDLGYYALALDGDGKPCRVAPPMPGICSMSACPPPSGPGASPTSCCPRTSAAAGECARWPRTRCRSTRCPTTMARSGPTTRRCVRAGLSCV